MKLSPIERLAREDQDRGGGHAGCEGDHWLMKDKLLDWFWALAFFAAFLIDMAVESIKRLFKRLAP